MPRPILDEAHIHPAIRDTVASYKGEVVAQVQAAIAKNHVVVIGMRQNPFPKKARKLLDERKIAYEYLEFGSYFAEWKRRGVLRMWSGWPTFPMIFMGGVLIGGFADLARLDQSGELAKMVQASGGKA
jgi:glutaredoxin-related protein